MPEASVHDHNDPWDNGDVLALIQGRRDGWSVKHIAKSLGRTPAAVHGKIHRLRKQGVLVPSRQ